MQVTFHRVDWEYASTFRIAYRTRTHAETVWVQLERDGLIARGEALGIPYHGETTDVLLDQLASVVNDVRNGATRADLAALLPAGGARNALDCALWDMEAKLAGRRVWELLGLQSVHALNTAYTLGLDAPQAMARAAAAASAYSLLKLKLNGDGDLERVLGVREARPDARLIVDANQAWSEDQLAELAPQFAALGVGLIEQPLPAGKDEMLTRFRSPVPLCADESCQTRESLTALEGKYDFVNVKLDKAGGLTEAWQLARVALRRRLRVMIGCMGGSSLSMAPAFVVGQLCDVVDLDGPLLAKSDVPDAIRYEGSRMLAPQEQLWG